MLRPVGLHVKAFGNRANRHWQLGAGCVPHAGRPARALMQAHSRLFLAAPGGWLGAMVLARAAGVLPCAAKQSPPSAAHFCGSLRHDTSYFLKGLSSYIYRLQVSRMTFRLSQSSHLSA